MKVLGLFGYATEALEGTHETRVGFFRDTVDSSSCLEELNVVSTANGFGCELDVEELAGRTEVSHIAIPYWCECDDVKSEHILLMQIVGRDASENTVTLMSESIVDYKPFNYRIERNEDMRNGNYWLKSYLRQYMGSNKFTDRFGAEFVSHVVLTNHSTMGLEHTDSFFIPSCIEIGEKTSHFKSYNNGVLPFEPYANLVSGGDCSIRLKSKLYMGSELKYNADYWWLRDEQIDEGVMPPFVDCFSGHVGYGYRYTIMSGIVPCCTIG